MRRGCIDDQICCMVRLLTQYIIKRLHLRKRGRLPGMLPVAGTSLRDLVVLEANCWLRDPLLTPVRLWPLPPIVTNCPEWRLYRVGPSVIF